MNNASTSSKFRRLQCLTLIYIHVMTCSEYFMKILHSSYHKIFPIYYEKLISKFNEQCICTSPPGSKLRCLHYLTFIYIHVMTCSDFLWKIECSFLMLKSKLNSMKTEILFSVFAIFGDFLTKNERKCWFSS